MNNEATPEKTLDNLQPGDDVIYRPAGFYHEHAEVMRLSRKTPSGLLVLQFSNLLGRKRDEYFYPNGQSRKSAYGSYHRSSIEVATEATKAAIQLASDRRYLENFSAWGKLPAEVIQSVITIVKKAAQ